MRKKEQRQRDEEKERRRREEKEEQRRREEEQRRREWGDDDDYDFYQGPKLTEPKKEEAKRQTATQKAPAVRNLERFTDKDRYPDESYDRAEYDCD